MAAIARPQGRDRFVVTVARVDGAVVVTATGALEESAPSRLAQILEDLIEGQGNRLVCVELPDVGEVDVKTLHVLLHAADQARAHRGRFTITTPVGRWERGAS